MAALSPGSSWRIGKALSALALGATLLPTPASAQVSAPVYAGGGAALTQSAGVEWSRRDGDEILLFSAMVVRSGNAHMAGVGLIDPQQGVVTTLYFVRQRCGVRHGRPWGCRTTRSESFVLGPTDVEFDPLLRSARVTSPAARARIEWTARGDYKHRADPASWRKSRTDGENVWWYTVTGADVDVTRRAAVDGRILGYGLDKKRASMRISSGNYQTTGGCLLDRGEICN